MDKSIFVIDTPKNCYECLLQYDFLHCIIAENMPIDSDITSEELNELREGYRFTNEYTDSRPKLCPLKSLPKRMGSASEYGSDEEYIKHLITWKKKVDEILGEE